MNSALSMKKLQPPILRACSVFAAVFLRTPFRKPPTDDEKPRTITYTYELPYGHDGRIDMGNKSKHNWISLSMGRDGLRPSTWSML